MDKKNRLHQERLDDVWDAASHGDHVRLSILLHTPSSIASNTYKTVALMAAVRNHKEATVQWLLNARADPNQEYAGCSVLDDAALLCTSKTILNLLVHNTKCPAVITPKTLRLAISREQYRTPQNNQFEWFMSNGGKECVQGTWHITELLQQCQDAGQPLAGQALALQDMAKEFLRQLETSIVKVGWIKVVVHLVMEYALGKVHVHSRFRVEPFPWALHSPSRKRFRNDDT